jgi:NDP-sugar pyrophosphorylase family protein
MLAMILAAGFGERLYPLTIDRAKPAIPFMNRPLVGYVAEYLAQFDCSEVVVNLHHRPESVRGALGDGSKFGVKLHYVSEREILGTSGAIDNARAVLGADKFAETFVVVNGKIVTDIDLNAALETHRRTDALATLVLRPNITREKYSTVEVHDGFVKNFGSAPTKEQNQIASDNIGDIEGKRNIEARNKEASAVQASIQSSVPLMFTGIQILEPRIFDYIPRGKFSHTTTDVYLPAIAKGERIAAHIADGMWHELSTIERYLTTHLDVMRRQELKFVAGENANLHPKAVIESSVLWEDVTVEAEARVVSSVLGAGVRVGRGEIFENVAVVRADLARSSKRPAKGSAGEFRGENFIVPLKLS